MLSSRHAVMRRLAWFLPLTAAVCLGWPVPLMAAPRQLTERQIDAILKRAETQLAAGQTLQAIRTTLPAAGALFTEESFSFPRYEELSDRMYAVAWVSVVRLGGSHDVDGKRATNPREVLEMAEARLRDLLPSKNPTWTARHGEALVALGDRMRDAYLALHALEQAGALREAESYAALTVAARATDHPDEAVAAQKRCFALGRQRAKRICPK